MQRSTYRYSYIELGPPVIFIERSEDTILSFTACADIGVARVTKKITIAMIT